jgi:hypothetical protein
MNVDEAGCQRQATGIDNRSRSGCAQIADTGNTFLAYAEIAAVRRPTRTVNDLGTCNNQIEFPLAAWPRPVKAMKQENENGHSHQHYQEEREYQ